MAATSNRVTSETPGWGENRAPRRRGAEGATGRGRRAVGRVRVRGARGCRRAAAAPLWGSCRGRRLRAGGKAPRQRHGGGGAGLRGEMEMLREMVGKGRVSPTSRRGGRGEGGRTRPRVGAGGTAGAMARGKRWRCSRGECCTSTTCRRRSAPCITSPTRSPASPSRLRGRAARRPPRRTRGALWVYPLVPLGRRWTRALPTSTPSRTARSELVDQGTRPEVAGLRTPETRPPAVLRTRGPTARGTVGSRAPAVTSPPNVYRRSSRGLPWSGRPVPWMGGAGAGTFGPLVL